MEETKPVMPDLIATWEIEVIKSLDGAVITMYALCDGANDDLADRTNYRPLHPIGLTLGRLKALRKELGGLIEALESAKARGRWLQS